MINILVNIDVDDLTKAVEFYTAAFELTVGRRFGENGVELLGGSSPIYLLVRVGGSRATLTTDQVRDYDRHWTPVHLDFVVDDLAATIARCLAAGATQEASVKPGNWGDLVLMADPFGHGFCLIQFKGRGYDEIASPV